MGTLVLYYSFTGKTKMLAEAVAKNLGFETLEIIEKKRHSTLGAYFIGARKAMQEKTVPIIPFDQSRLEFDSLMLFTPVWAGSPVPAVNAAIEELDLKGVRVMVNLVQKGNMSESAEVKIRKRLEKKGAIVIGCTHVQMDVLDTGWIKAKAEVLKNEYLSVMKG